MASWATIKSASRGWTKGLARFNELRYYEAYAPRDVDWWWDNAIGTNRPTAPVNSPVSAFDTHRAYLSSVYNQGARFFDALRTRLGADRFNAFLRDLYQRGSFRLITTQDFLKVLQEDAGVDVRSVVRRFLRYDSSSIVRPHRCRRRHVLGWRVMVESRAGRLDTFIEPDIIATHHNSTQTRALKAIGSSSASFGLSVVFCCSKLDFNFVRVAETDARFDVITGGIEWKQKIFVRYGSAWHRRIRFDRGRMGK